ncbi:MAG: ATP-binding protein [Clostridiales bacterium]|jgi:anti-sigma regulatory factor (Ser/Thr protein kinase)|nr:ATP-binding protein [Clostridiales bacterium]
MRELSLNILDVAHNSIAAGASLLEIVVEENSASCEMLIGIYDNGCGMSADEVQNVTDPFFTTRTTRRIGLGVPLFKQAAEMTGGAFRVESRKNAGTRITAQFKTDSVDFIPLGDICSTILMLITMNTNRDFLYRRIIDGREFALDTRELKDILGDVPLNEPEVAEWMRGFIEEQTQIISGGVK